MEAKPFGVNLKRTGADPVHDKGFVSGSSSAGSAARKTSYTPLKPANVQDLKAMFDDKKGAGGTKTASSSGASSPRSGPVSPRSGTTSPRSGSSSPAHSAFSSKKSESVTSTSTRILSSTSTSSAVTKGVASDNKSTSKLSSGVTTTNVPRCSAVSSVSSRDNAFPSRINITTSPPSSRRGDRSSVGRSWSPKRREADTKTSLGLKSSGLKSAEKKEETRVEIPVQHVTGKRTPSGTYDNKSKLESSGSSLSTSSLLSKTSGKGTTAGTAKTSSMSSLTSQKTSTDQNSASSRTGLRAGTREIPVQRVSSDSNKTEKSTVNTTTHTKRLTKGNNFKSFEENKSNSLGKPNNPEVADPRMLSVRKMSSERFERLKFDFERGVPTESQERRASETTDHIELQMKAREMQRAKLEAEEEKAAKEESIFAKGMKVSDFVKHINTVHPPSHSEGTNAKTFKVGGPRILQTSKSDPGGENEYIEMPEESAEDGIYEFVGEGEGEGAGAEKKKSSSLKAPSRRHGVYSGMDYLRGWAQKLKDKGKRASLKRKKEQSTPEKDASTNDNGEVTTADEVVITSGEDEWSSASSDTEYEPVEPEGEDNLYEDPDTLGLTDGKKKKKEKEEGKDGGQSLGNKLKKNVDKATNYLNKITKFNKKKAPKDGANVQYISGPISGTGTDSEADIIDDDDALSDNPPLSRTSSERSSGRLTRTKNKELSVDIPKMQQQQGEEDDQGGVATPPPPLPPRASKVLKEMSVENSPPLPPRNPAAAASLRVGLDVVVPITPPGSGRGDSSADSRKKDRFSFGKDSYLGGQEMHSGDSVDAPDYELAKPDSYLEFDPAAAPKLPERKDSSKRKKLKSLFSKTSGSQGPRTSTASYLYPDNISDWPQINVDSDDDELYIELEDDQIYGRLDRQYSTKFESEPLYQWYAKDKIMQTNRQLSASDVSGSGEDTESSTDDSVSGEQVYESVERLLQRSSTRRSQPDSFERNAPARRSVIMDVFGRSGSLHRALWCEMPEVIRSGVLLTMDPQEKKVQESMFEIMTSEASYLKSLNILINVFLLSPEFGSDMNDRCVITKRERQFLFSNIGCIRDISAKFLADLEARWQESCIMNDICDIITKHAQKNFEPYIRYCSNQAFQERALESLQKKTEFSEAVKSLEQNPDCQFLPMSSFLLLPMQRITRLPLLVDAVRHRLDPATKRHESASKALDYLSRVVKQCNDGAKKMLQTEQMCLLAANLEFTKVKEFPLVSSSRYLVKQGELNKIVTEGTSRIPFGRRSKEHVYLYLFNDILLITKKRGNVYQVRDYCQRNALHTQSIDNAEKSKFVPQGASGVKNLFLLALLSNHEGKQVELLLYAKSESERARWLDAILPEQTNPEYERIYEDWDCPQVQCVVKYIAQEPDELTLEESDVINVFKKMGDGWYEGERIRDGERGWFPADHTEEINNSHVRARNLRLRYRLMIASQDYTDMKFGN
ncbi:uncharacterized protein LOC143287661 isoform X2 [Babylonia areolata]|uniref:uncharacterized protein LOC143287661 isoform X2 n=1 Tax=Babylonia areolata TaxID=304850 RepID=UPI003FD0262B